MSRRLRLAGFILALALLVWLPFEENHPAWALLLAAGLAAWLAVWIGKRLRSPWAAPGMGALAGLAAPVLALALLVFKTGVHAHPQPDYSLAQMAEILRSLPWWALAGLLVGAGWGLLHTRP